MHILYNRVYHVTRAILDIAASGTFMNKRAHEAYELLEEMFSTNHNSQIDKSTARRPIGIHQVDVVSSLATQIEALNRKIEKL